MQLDFHYYATYCAAFLAGYNHDESCDIAYSAQFVDCCTSTYLKKIDGSQKATTTQTQIELVNSKTDFIGLQYITRIWASFHFLPHDLYSKIRASKSYKDRYHLICMPNGALVKDTVELAKDKSLQAVGVAMHVLADTWAHSGFCGTPSLVINNTNRWFYEILPDKSERHISLVSSTSVKDDPDKGVYTGSLYQPSELSIMNLGHGRCGHLPDYSYARYKYLPAWGNYNERIKDNPSDYYHAFAQMVYAMKYLRGNISEFETDKYDFDGIAAYKGEIMRIIEERRTDASADWKAFGESLSGCIIPDFDVNAYTKEFISDKDKISRKKTFLGLFIKAAVSHKSMVTNRIFKSRNLLAGFSRDYKVTDDN